MPKKSQRRRAKSRQHNIRKSQWNAQNPSVAPPLTNNTTENISRYHKSAIGTSGMALNPQINDTVKPFDLTYGRRIWTYLEMGLDDAIATCLTLGEVMVGAAFNKFYVDYNTKSEESKKNAKFVDYCFRNMNYQDIVEFAITANTFQQFGFSVVEKTYDKVKTGEYEGRWKIDRLCERPQNSLDVVNPFVITKDGRRVAGVKQNIAYLFNTPTGGVPHVAPIEDMRGGWLYMPRNKVMIFGYNATESNPAGTSPLDRCYKVWREKNLIEEYQLIGVSKDLSGTIKQYIPLAYLERAALDPNSKEAAVVDKLQMDIANMHAGDQNSVIVPSDGFTEAGGGFRQFDMELMQSGGSKQFDTAELIEKKRKAIFDVFGASNVLTGENGGGSYALMEGKNALNAHYVANNVNIIVRQINNDLIPQLLALNGIYPSKEDMPRFVAGAIEPLSLDEASKMVQRVMAVGGLVKTKENIIDVHKMLGLDTRHMENMTKDELWADMQAMKMQSRSGDGMESGMPSGTSDVQAGDTSANNMNHKATVGLRCDAKGYFTMTLDGERIDIAKSDIDPELLKVLEE